MYFFKAFKSEAIFFHFIGTLSKLYDDDGNETVTKQKAVHVVHVRYKSLYISSLSSAKQQGAYENHDGNGNVAKQKV